MGMSRKEWVLIGVATVVVAVVLGEETLPKEVWLAVVGIVVGGAITALFSWYFYQRAARELLEETSHLKRAMEQGGTVRFERDENGNLTRVIIDIDGAASGAAGGAAADLTVG